jgi:hypothetical protein
MGANCARTVEESGGDAELRADYRGGSGGQQEQAGAQAHPRGFGR